MTITIDIIISSILLLAGFVYTCYYFNNNQTASKKQLILRFTRNKILYLLVGILMAGILIGLFELKYSLDAILQVKLLSLVMIMLPIAVIDLREQKIPNQLLEAALVIRLVICIVEFIMSVPAAINTLKDGFLGAIIIGAFFLLLLLIFKNSIGMGDIKLFMVMGLYQGFWGVINAVFFSLMVSFFLSFGLLITRRKGCKDTIPFGPSIFIGTVVAMGLAGM